MYTENFVKSGRVVFEICERIDRQTDRHNTENTHLNSLHPYLGRSNPKPYKYMTAQKCAIKTRSFQNNTKSTYIENRIVQQLATTYVQGIESITYIAINGFLANLSSRSRLLYAVARPSVVCLSSVTFVRPTQAVQTFGNISTALGTLANGHPLTYTENFTEIVPGEPLRRGS